MSDAPELVGPHSLEAEQALLGAVLFDNEAYHRIPSLRAEAFAEPFHQRLWAAMEGAITKNLLAEPIMLMERFRDDLAYEELGGLRYLADLVDRAPPAAAAYSYAQGIREMAARRELVRIGGELISRAREDHDTPTSDQIVEAEADLYKLAEGAASTQGFVEFATVMRGAVEQAEAAHSRGGKLVGLTSGLRSLDGKLGGLHRSDLLILAGRPSMGKTALATNIAFRAAKHGHPVGFFSLEMSAEQLGLRILSDVVGIPGDRIRRGDTNVSEIARIRDAAAEIERSPLHTDATGGIGIAQLTARARRMKRLHGLDLIVVDYLQLVTTKAKAGSNRVGEVTEITSGLKALAKELNVPVLALSQLSRAVEQRDDKRPQLSDLRESGSIEQDADVVMFVYREAYYLGRNEPKEGTVEHRDWQDKMDLAQGLAEVIIGKQRHGPIGTVRLAFDDATTRFTDTAEEERYPAAARGPRAPRYSFGGPE